MKRKAILLIALILISTMPYSPDMLLNPDNKLSSGASNADVSVSELTITTPSVSLLGINVLSPMEHIIRISLVNYGGSDANGTLTLSIDDGSSSTEVDTRDIYILAGQQENHLLYWDAYSATDISLNAIFTIDPSEVDSDSSNDYLSLLVDVYDIEDAEILATTLPNEGTTLARAPWSGIIAVQNSGTLPVDVTAQMSLVSTAQGANPISIYSTIVQPPVGSLSNPAAVTNVDISFDATSLEGLYIISGFVQTSGADGSVTTDSLPTVTVEFEGLTATLSSPVNRNIDPGQSTTLSFLLINSGQGADTFTVTQSNLTGWAKSVAEIFTISSPLSLGSGESSIIQIEVEVPLDAAVAATDRITIDVHSISNQYDLTSSAIVSAGETYEGTIIQSSTNPLGVNYVDIGPGMENKVTIDYELNNTGTAPAQYEINVGMLQAAPYWQIYSPVELTNLILPGENITIPVTITLPELEMPLQSSWKIDAGLQLQLRIQAIPTAGGIDVVASTYITVLPAVMIDIDYIDLDLCPESNSDGTFSFCPGDITEEEIYSGQAQRFINFEVQAKHNLDATGEGSAIVSVSQTHSHTPLVVGAAPNEENKWPVTIAGGTNGNFDLEIGEIGYGVLTIDSLDPPSSPYVGAGQFKVDVTANTVFDISDFNGNAPITGVNNSSIKFDIPELEQAEMTLKSRGEGTPGTAITAEMILINYGNSPNNFNVSYIAEPGWTISVTNPGTIKSWSDSWGYDVGTIPIEKSFTVTATPPETASADKIHNIWIYASSLDTGEILAYASADFKLDELISANLNTGASTSILDRLGTSTIMFELNNTGNSNQTFDLKLENSDNNYLQVSFSEDDTVIQTEKTMLVNSGSTAIIRVYSKASKDARADQSTTFDLILSNNLNELSRKTMTVTVNPDHALNLQGNTVYYAQPGTTIQASFNLQNLGNLLEKNISFNANLPDGPQTGVWIFDTINNLSISPGVENSLDIIMNITIPDIGPNVMLEAGGVYNIPIQIFSYDFTGFDGNYIVLGTNNIVVNIEPYFELHVEASSDSMNLVPHQTRTFSYSVLNAGNAPALVNMNYNLAVSDNSRWQVTFPNLPSTSFTIPIGETYEIELEITPIASDHYVGESGTFDIIFTSSDDAEETMSFSTIVQVIRVQTDDEVIVDPGSLGQGDGLLPCASFTDPNIEQRCSIFRIPWMHVPSLGSTDATPVNYNLTVLKLERHIDENAYPNSLWTFYVEDSLLMSTLGFGVTSEAVQPYDTGSKFDLTFIIPETENLAPGDGWSITFRLKNPNEPNTAAYWTDFTVDIVTTTTSDPMIKSMYFSTGSLLESSSSTLIVEIKNAGDAVMPLGAEVQVSCNGKYIDSFKSGNQIVPALASQQSFNSSWEISAKSIPWWSASEPLECIAQLTGTAIGVKGNHIDNDILTLELSIDSWTPPKYILKVGSNNIEIPISALISVIFLLVALYLYRNGKLDFTPSYIHLSAYSFAASMAALALTNWFSMLPLICAILTVLGSITIAWASSSELQAIHNDKKKSLTGARATMSNHDIEAKKTLKELRAIISCAPLTLLLVMLINPNLSIDMSTKGILGLFLYILITPIFIHLVLRYLDRSYGKIYGQLGMIELRAIKIKKILANQQVSKRFQPKNRLGGRE